MSALGLGRVKTLPSSPMSAAGADAGTDGRTWRVWGNLSTAGEPPSRDDVALAPDQAWIAFINGPLPTMFSTRVRL